MSNPKEAPTESAGPPRKRKGKRLLILLVLTIVVLAGGGGGAFYWWSSRQAAVDAAAGGDAHAQEPRPEEVSGALPFAPFIVNLADPGASRYLKADLRLLVTGVENLTELEEDEVTMMRLRSAILEHLSQQTSDRIATAEGKEALKAAIAERCTGILGHAKVSDVLFNEFVVQF